MADAASDMTDARPIRELVDPTVEKPMARDQGAQERRKEHRFSRRLSGVLTANAMEHPIRCDDVSYRGLRLVAPASLRLRRGQHVDVQLGQGSSRFRDEFSVRGYEATAGGTVLHLGM